MLMGICERHWIVPIPKVSLHRRQMRGAPTEPRTLGEHLRVKRIDMGLTQPQLSEMLRVAWQTVERWEHNYRTIRPASQANIVAFLGFDPLPENREPLADSIEAP